MASVKRRPPLPLPAVLCLNFVGLMVLATAYGLYGKRYMTDRRYERSEAYASFLYEKLKEEKGNVGMES